jgi:hypothetical protein
VIYFILFSIFCRLPVASVVVLSSFMQMAVRKFVASTSLSYKQN